jgi:hypothetical protein
MTHRIARRSMSSAAITALVLAVVLVAPAGAAAPTKVPLSDLTGGVSGTRTTSDRECSKDRSNPRRMTLTLKNFAEPGTLVVETCDIFTGAKGGVFISGDFVLETASGTARGPVEGSIGFTDVDNLSARLTVRRGTGSLRATRGTLQLNAEIDDGNVSGWLSLPN